MLCPVHQDHKYYDYWTPVISGATALDKYQSALISLVQKALDSGLFYNSELMTYVKKHNDFIPGDAWALQYPKGHEVEGGLMGMEIYSARKAIREAREREDNKKAVALYPAGTIVGTVSLQGKRYTGVKVATYENGLAVMEGKAGSNKATWRCAPSTIIYIVERAVLRGWRKA